jgi:hypothetical protein
MLIGLVTIPWRFIPMVHLFPKVPYAILLGVASSIASLPAQLLAQTRKTRRNPEKLVQAKLQTEKNEANVGLGKKKLQPKIVYNPPQRLEV